MSIIPDFGNQIPRWPFGKYRDTSIEVIIKHDPRYIVWAMGFLDFMEVNKDFIQRKWTEIWPNRGLNEKEE